MEIRQGEGFGSHMRPVRVGWCRWLIGRDKASARTPESYPCISPSCWETLGMLCNLSGFAPLSENRGPE